MKHYKQDTVAIRSKQKALQKSEFYSSIALFGLRKVLLFVKL